MAVEWDWSAVEQRKQMREGPSSRQGAEIGAFLRSDEIPGQRSAVDSKLNNASGPNAPDLELISSELPSKTGAFYNTYSIASPLSLHQVCSRIRDMGISLIDQPHTWRPC